MSKAVKRMMIDDIRGQVSGQRDFVLVDVSRMDAVATNQLRLELRKKGVSLLTVKNTLARVALREEGVDLLDSCLEGPTTLAWGGEDVVGLSREMAEWAKKIEPLEIKGGAVDGQGVDSAAVVDISKGPSRLELIGQISGLLLSPGARLSGALLGAGGKLAGQVLALAEKEDGGDAA